MLLPFTLKQMRASPALMSEWRLAAQRAAMQHAQAEAQASAGSLFRPRHAASAAAQSPAAAWAPPDGLSGHPAAMPMHLAQPGAVILDAGDCSSSSSSSSGQADTVRQAPNILGMPDSSSSSSIGGPRVCYKQDKRFGSDATDTISSAPAAGTLLGAAASAQHDSHRDDSSGQRSEGGGRPYQAPAKGPSMKSIMEEYRRIRGGSSAPGPAWLIGGPLLQVRQ